MVSPPAGIDHGRSLLDLGPRPCAEFEVVVAVFGGLLVLKLMPIEETALAMGQGASLDDLFLRVDVDGFQCQVAAIQIGGGKPSPIGIERLLEGAAAWNVSARRISGFRPPRRFRGF